MEPIFSPSRSKQHGINISGPSHSTPVKTVRSGSSGVAQNGASRSGSGPTPKPVLHSSCSLSGIRQTLDVSSDARDCSRQSADCLTGQRNHHVGDHSSSLLASRQAQICDFENSTIQKQREELELLIAELRERDRELNDMVAAHQKQMVAWQRDRQKIVTLEEKCDKLGRHLQRKGDALRQLQAQLHVAESEDLNKSTALNNTQEQLNTLAEQQSQSTQRLQELQHDNRALSSSLREMSANIGQWEVREQELLTVIQLKDKDMVEASAHIAELSDKVKRKEAQLREVKDAECDVKRKVTEWKNKYLDQQREVQYVKKLLSRSEQQADSQNVEIKKLKQELSTTRTQVTLAGEREKRKDQLLELQKSKQERCDAELNSLRMLYETQQRDLTMLHLNLENTKALLESHQNHNMSSLGYQTGHSVSYRQRHYQSDADVPGYGGARLGYGVTSSSAHGSLPVTSRPFDGRDEPMTSPSPRGRVSVTSPLSRGRDVVTSPLSRERDVVTSPLSRERDSVTSPLSREPDLETSPLSREPDLVMSPLPASQGYAASSGSDASATDSETHSGMSKDNLDAGVASSAASAPGVKSKEKSAMGDAAAPPIERLLGDVSQLETSGEGRRGVGEDAEDCRSELSLDMERLGERASTPDGSAAPQRLAALQSTRQITESPASKLHKLLTESCGIVEELEKSVASRESGETPEAKEHQVMSPGSGSTRGSPSQQGRFSAHASPQPGSGGASPREQASFTAHASPRSNSARTPTSESGRLTAHASPRSGASSALGSEKENATAHASSPRSNSSRASTS